MTFDSYRPPVCGAITFLPSHLVEAAVGLAAPGSAERADVERHVRCTLQAHPADGDHHGLVMDLEGRDTGSVWTRWGPGRPPAEVVVLPDCPGEAAAGGEACCEFEGHPGGHSYELADEWAAG